MTAKERVRMTLEHREPPQLAVDFGSTPTSGISASMVYKLRKAFGLKEKPVRIIDCYQMLGEVEEDLREKLGVDCAQIMPYKSMFGFRNADFKEWTLFDGTPVLVPEGFNTRLEPNGGLYQYAEGDQNFPPSGYMPAGGYYFDSIVRQGSFDEDEPSVEDNLQEFVPITDEELRYVQMETERLAKSADCAITATMGGTALGDIALVPAPFLKEPQGIRDMEGWYMSLALRPDFLKEVYDRQTEIAIANLKRYWQAVGDKVDVMFLCGTDLGTQTGLFCSPETFREVYLPYYKKMTDWIHQNTTWNVFKHCCGSIMPLIDGFIDAGFDALNPVQISAANMDPQTLKDRFGGKITFWGGGVDPQKTLAFGSPDEVYAQTSENIRIFRTGGGFVFGGVHNVQANVPLENVLAMLEAVKDHRKAK